MKFKKIEKNILICSLSIVGLGAIIGTSVAVANELKINKGPLLSNNNNQNESNKVFSGTTLTKNDVKEIGWDKKTTISLNDWKKQAPKVTQIGDESAGLAPFYANNLLQSIEIPAQVTNISNSSFYSTPSLTKVTFEENSSLTRVGQKAFNNSAIKEIVIPQSVKSIGEDAFRNISNLSSDKIFLPEELKKSNDPLYGFTEEQWEATKSTKATFDGTTLTRAGVRTLGWNTKQEITLADWDNAPNVTEISVHSESSSIDGAFSGSETLTKITIPARITKINGFSFNGSSVREIAFEHGSQLKEIRKSAFLSAKLTKIQIPVGVRRLEDGAFNGAKLTSLQVPHSVTSIGHNTFGNTNLTLTGRNIKMPISFINSGGRFGFNGSQWNNIQWTTQFLSSNLDKEGVKRVGWDKVRDITIYDWENQVPNVVSLAGNPTGDSNGDKSSFSDVTELRTIQIPDKINSIGFSSFARTANLRTITFGQNSKLTNIDNYAFTRSGIQNIVIPRLTTRIGQHAFSSTVSLNSVTFAQNATIKSIEANAFLSSNIKSITVPNVTGITIGADAFKSTSLLKGPQISFPDSLRGNNPSQAKYGLTPAQWNSINWGAAQHTGSILTKQLVNSRGWSTKTDITLEDWKRDFPTITELGEPSITSGPGDRAPFSLNNNLRSIVIPKEIKKINYAAFFETPNLRTITFEPGSQLTDIGGYSFRKSGITNITIPNTVTTLGEAAFDEAKKLLSITIPKSIRTLNKWLFRLTDELQTVNFAPGSTLESIGQEVFQSSGIFSIRIPKTVKSIGTYAFLRTHFLKSFTFEEGSQLTTLGHRAFQNAGFSTLVLPRTLTTVAPEAFTNSFSITNITMSSKLRGGSLDARYGMSSTQWNNITWLVERFNGDTLTRSVVIDLNWYKKEEIPLSEWQNFAPNVKNLGASSSSGTDSPFANLTTLKSIAIPKTVININYQAFFQTTGLTTISFEDNSKVANIGTRAFAGSNIRAINIPDSVTTIATDAFTNTNSLLGASISMSSKFRKGSLNPFYGFTKLQWDSINWRVAKFEGTILTKRDVIDLNWHTKGEITQADWTNFAPRVTKIGAQPASGVHGEAAFSDNKTLNTIYIPAKITNINFSAFSGASNLRTVNFEQNSQLAEIGNFAFKGTGVLAINVPDATKVIGYGSFENATRLVAFAFGPSSQLESVFGRAFFGASSLPEIIFPEKAKRIGEHAFWNAKSLRKVYIPNSVDTIGETAFNGTDRLEGNQVSMLITLRGTPPEKPKYGFTPRQWNSIAWRVVPFDGLTLTKADVEKIGWDTKTTITLADWQNDAPKVTAISTSATSGDSPTAAFIGNNKLQTIAIPDTITRINFGSFSGASALQTISFGRTPTLSTIEAAAFRNSSINSIVIPSSVTTIGNSAFQTPNLRSISFGENSALTSIGETAFDGTGISAINVPSSVTSIGSNAFRNTGSLQGANISMDISLRQDPTVVKYGFNKTQWDAIVWRGNITLSDEITSFRIDFTEGKNIVDLPALVSKASSTMSEEAKYVGLSLQFAVGTTPANLIANWGTGEAVKTQLATYANTSSILRSQINIYAKMYLPSGEGSLGNMIGSITYHWKTEPIQIYNNQSGIIDNVFVAPSSTVTLSNKFIRAYSKVADNWAESLIASGNKSTEVRVTSTDNSFVIASYDRLGIKLEVNPNNDNTSWREVMELGTDVFNASATNKMKFRLSVKDNKAYEIIGSDAIVDTSTTPSGTMTKVIEKNIIAKIELTGINSVELISNKLSVTGTTHDLVIVENPELYTASGLPLDEAKKFFEIKYSYNGTDYLNVADFTAQLKSLRGAALNGLTLANFKVKYEFTAAGLQKYYSTQVANDPEAGEEATRPLTTTGVLKTIDVTTQIADIPKIQISGTTANISWSGNSSIISLNSLVKVQYGTYVQDTDGTVTYRWSEELPTSLYITTPPAGQTDYPLAIRFLPKDGEESTVQIGSIGSDNSFIEADKTKGYAVNVNNLLSIINIDTKNLSASLLLIGFANNLNGGASITDIESPAINLVAAEFRSHVKLEYQISTLGETWLSLEELQTYLKTYLSSYQNATSGIIIFDNGTISGATIKAQFVPKDPKKFSVVSSPTKEVTLDTKGIKTSVDLREYVKVLETEKVIPTGTSPDNLGKLTIPSMKNGNLPFSGKTFTEIQEILGSSIDIEFKAPGFNDDKWVSLEQITKVNVDNELYIRFVVKTQATNIELSLVTSNDGSTHENGFKLKLNLPLEIQTSSADLTRLIKLTGDTRNLVIDDAKVYEELIAKNEEYRGKIKLLYTIGKVPMALDPNFPNKTEFTKEELEKLLKQNTVDVTINEKQITAKYALAPGVNPEDFIIKDKRSAELNVENVKLFINRSNYYELARKLSVKGTSSQIVWGSEINELTRNLSAGLILQYSTDPTAKATDLENDSKWSKNQPTQIDPTNKFLAVRMVVVTGYVFEESPELFRVNTDNVLLVITLQSTTLDLIKISGNTKDLTINLADFNAAIATAPGKDFIEVQYYFGGTPPIGLNIPAGTEWFNETQIKAILLALKGAKNQNELILFRDSLKARYSLNEEGYRTYRLNIDGIFIEEKAPETPGFWRQLVTTSINANFQGYINLDLINTFVADSFKVIGSDKKPQLVVTEGISKMLDYYKDQKTAPFDIYYSKTKGNFNNKDYKLFGADGFINEFDKSFTIDLDTNGLPRPIWFKIEAREGYQIYEKKTLLNGGKEIEITNFDIQPQITNPLKVPPTIRFQSESGELFYQGQGSFSVYDTTTGLPVNSDFLNKEYPEVTPAVLKLQYNVSDKEYTQEELAAVIEDANQWKDMVPADLKVGQYVMVRVALNNDKFTMIGGDAMTPQTRVSGLKVRTQDLRLSQDLILTNTDFYGFQALDGQAKIERATIIPDTDGSDNYLGADLQMSVNTQFYRNTAGKIIVDANNIPIIKRNPDGATVSGNYLDSTGNTILDAEGKPIPILTVQKGASTIPAPPLTDGEWLKPRKMIDSSVIGSFSQFDDGLLDWRLFEGQTVRFSFIARVGQGTEEKPDFIFDTSANKNLEPEIQLTKIKYIIPTHGVTYRFDQEQLKNITFASDDNGELAYTGSSHIASQLSAIRVSANYEERTIIGSDIENQVKEDFDNRVQIKMKLDKVNGTSSSAFGSDIRQFRGLSNGDVLTISFESIDENYSLPRPIPPLTIIIKGLFVRPLNTELFKYLRPNFTGALNGSGAFSIKVTNPANPSQTNEDILGQDQWYEYQVWDADKQIKTPWTRDETRINNLVNGDKVEWKIVNKDGVFENDYYNTLLANSDTSSEIKFKVVNVVDKIEQTVQEGIGNSNQLNPDSGGRPNYPEDSGWVVSGLKVEINLDSVQQQKFEQALAQFQPTFSGVDKFGSMNSNILNDTPISQEVVIVWYAAGEDGMPRKITDFKDAGLSNGDKVWATIAPSQYAIDNNLIIDGSISQMSSKVFIVEGLTTIVNSTTQTLMISLISGSSVLLVGAIGSAIFIKKKGKLNGNRQFKS